MMFGFLVLFLPFKGQVHTVLVKCGLYYVGHRELFLVKYLIVEVLVAFRWLLPYNLHGSEVLVFVQVELL